MGYLTAVLHPTWYQGFGKKPPYFEGWYYKLIDATTQHKYAFIPGVFLTNEPHAFIQVLDGSTAQAWYHRYPMEAFWAADDRLEVQIGKSVFTDRTIRLDIDKPDQYIIGEITFRDVTPWPVTLTSPGIMGWYAWIPTMECYHGIVSLDHALDGQLIVDNGAVSFNNGRGYSEKDRGRSFPSSYIWMQSNHFDTVGTSLTASIAMIPWRTSRFPGFIVGLYHEGVLLRFATYTGAKTETLAVTPETVRWTMRDKTHRLEIEARRGPESQFGLLKGPNEVEMGKRIAETLTATVRVRLSTLADGRTLFAENGRFAGLEVYNVEELLAEWGNDSK